MTFIDSSKPQLADLQVILAVTEEGTITHAAHRLGTSQSALSYRLERMRQRYGDRLFVRVGHQMVPTPLAQRLLGPATRIMRILETEVAALTHFDPATSTREFRLGTHEIGAITLVPRIVDALARQAPNITVQPMRIANQQVSAQLESGELDLVAGHLTGLQGRLLQQLLYRREYTCVARINHPFIGASLSWEEFHAAPQVWSHGTPQALNWIEAKQSAPSRPGQKHMSTQHFSAIPFIVASSDLIALIPIEVYELFRPIAPIRRVALPTSPPVVEIHQYWHPRFAGDPALRFFRNLVYEVARNRHDAT